MHEEIRLTLSAMTYGGEAMGRDDQGHLDESGRVVFVPYAIAGEEVVVEIVEEKKSFARARVVKVVKASPARITPRCPHFGPTSPPSPPLLGEESKRMGCGGCQWQHIAYDAQLKFKTDIVREQFARIAQMPNALVRDAIGMRDPWRYRNNVQFQLDADGNLCFRALESHDLIRITECHIIHPLVDEMFRALELDADFAGVTLRAGTRTREKMMILEGRDNESPEIQIDEPVSIAYQNPRGDVTSLVGKDALHEQLRRHAFRISPQSFFQVNTEMAETLVDLVERYLAPRPEDILLDAFGGVGTFGLLFAPRVARVIEVEENPRALEDARANAFESSNVEFHKGSVQDILPRLKNKIDIVVCDPPRAGIAPRALDALITKSPRALAYVSCDPATLARDARRLADGGYRLREVQPVDLFPQTYHIESVSWFERK